LTTVYAHPEYYEIAFSFRDIAQEVDLFEQLIDRHSAIPVSRLLELGCGHAPHLAELVRRGYQYVGLDLSREMLAYAKRQAGATQAPARFYQVDMVDFVLEEPVDFAFVLLGSLQVGNRDQLVSHFDSVGRALRSGGLYLLDWCVNFAPQPASVESWEITRGPVRVRTTYQTRRLDPVQQIVEEVLSMEVRDGAVERALREVALRYEVYPQEFLSFVAHRDDFEFLGWWNNWDLAQPLEDVREINRPIILLRRRQGVQG